MNRFFTVFFVVLFLSGCSKSLLTTNTLPCKFRLTEQAQLLIDKRWREVSIEAGRSRDATPSTKGFKDITGQFSPNDLDDLMIFSRKGTYVFDEGMMKARPESRQIYESGSWCICKDSRQLALINGPSITVYDIIELQQNSLVLQLYRTREEIADIYLLTFQPFE